MRYFEIRSMDSGAHLGAWQADSPEQALASLLRDAGAPEGTEPDEQLVATDVTEEVTELVLGGYREADLLSAGALPRAREEAEEAEEEGEARDNNMTLAAAMTVAATRGYELRETRRLLTRALEWLRQDAPRDLVVEVEGALGCPEDGPDDSDSMDEVRQINKRLVETAVVLDDRTDEERARLMDRRARLAGEIMRGK